MLMQAGPSGAVLMHSSHASSLPPHEPLNAAVASSSAASSSSFHPQQTASAVPATSLPSQGASLPYLQLMQSYPPSMLRQAQPLFFFPSFTQSASPSFVVHTSPPGQQAPSSSTSMVDVQQSAFTAFVSASSSSSSQSSSTASASSSSSSSSSSSASPRPPVGLAVAGLLGLSNSSSASTTARSLPSSTLPASSHSPLPQLSVLPGSLLVPPSPLLQSNTAVASPVAIKAERLSPQPSAASSPLKLLSRTHSDGERSAWSPPVKHRMLTAPATISSSSVATLARQLNESLSHADMQSAVKAAAEAMSDEGTQGEISALLQSFTAATAGSASTPPAAVAAFLLAVVSASRVPLSPRSSASPSPCPHCSSQKKGTRWSNADDGAMVSMVREGKDWEEVATRLRRTVRALKDRYCHLKKVEERRREGRDGRSSRRSNIDDDDSRRSRRDRDKERRKKRKKRRGVESDDSTGSSDSGSDSSHDDSDGDEDRVMQPLSHSSQAGNDRHRSGTEQPSSQAAHEERQQPRPESHAGEEQREDVDGDMPGLSPPTSPSSPVSSSVSSFSSSSPLAPHLPSSQLSSPSSSVLSSSSSALLPWTAADEFRLFSLLNSGLTIRDASVHLGRTLAAVKGRLQRLKRKREQTGHRKEDADGVDSTQGLEADDERGSKGSEARREPHPASTVMAAS